MSVGASKKNLVKDVVGVKVISVRTVNPPNLIANSAVLVNASNDSFLVHIDRVDLKWIELRRHINLTPLEGKSITLTLEPMNLDISGYVVQTIMLGNGMFALNVNFGNKYSNYFKECLFDLLPSTDEVV